MFEHDADSLKTITEAILRRASELGATGCAVDVSENAGLEVNVRRRRVETIEQTRDKGMGVTVYIGSRRGHASSSDFDLGALRETVSAAYEIARFTAEDPCAGLPEPETLAVDAPDLDLFHPWELDAEGAIALAIAAETAAFETSPQIRNSEGASVSIGHGHFFSANSLGFASGYRFSRHSLGCSPIAQRGRSMQRDDWYSSHCDPMRLADPLALGHYAAQRALARLGARRMATCNAPVLFESPLACGLLGHFVQAVSGTALYRKASFLLDSLGQAVFPAHVDIEENPHLRGEPGSAPFDAEGVATQRRKLVSAGVVQGYFLSTYSGRKLGMPSTGSAGGSHGLSLTSRHTRPRDNLDAMLRKLGTGLFVTELLGHGINYLTGDYSRGASGFWVENGAIAYPVEEITIAGNMREMFASIEAIGADVLLRGNKRCGSVLLGNMAIAGT